MIIDGKNAILGRLASFAAKQLLNGEEVKIVNSEKIIITGSKKSVKEDYHNRRRIGSAHHGPYFPTKPDMIVRRAIRGMLPYKTARGRDAFKRLQVFISAPEDLKTGAKPIATKEIKSDFVYVEDISKSLGWKKQGV